MAKIAGIDVHKKLLVVVIADEAAPEQILEQGKFGAVRSELERLRQYLSDLGVTTVVMESTAQYWRPVWDELEGQFSLHLAHAQSNRAPKGRKSDFRDGRRLIKRFVAHELFLSYVPEPEQREWRMLTRARLALVHDRVHLQNQVEALLEQASIKLSSVVSDLFGASGLRILAALSEGNTDPDALANLANHRLRASRETLVDALRGRFTRTHQQLLKQALDRFTQLTKQLGELNEAAAQRLQPHADTVARLIEVPGIGPEAAQELIAELGPHAATFPSSGELASWIGVCPGRNESAGENHSSRSPKGNRYVRRLLAQVAHAASHTKGSRLQVIFRKFLARQGVNQAIWTLAHRITVIVWHILHDGARYIEYGEAVNPKAAKRAIEHHLKALRRLGYTFPEPVVV